ncbi:hypothetical protein GTQ43_15645 [Nostoc sp. KVJ3]|uniref:hypothetical protein n=1 Tax=Nostoc sp. KVJ3 TaxID=457945 RepID=UPI002236F35A|nr:hypothetical protein [Nostoc sp. KVJ3]MCW5315191.1 hypothetical protein [Nostoc sp. KVJ3]
MKLLAQTNCTALVSVDIGVVREFAQQYQINDLPSLPVKIMFKVENWVQYWPIGTPR